ncbi:MAG: ferritin-like domain-containing protein [Solirubrobacteraceae bacterium]|nr:ferritin-like domain-containing protein [Patulibacter sp.]
MSDHLHLESLDGSGAIREAAEAAGAFDSPLDRRSALRRGATVAAGAALTTGFFATMLSPAEAAIVKGQHSKTNDVAILNYALTLEYLESAFYAQAVANLKFTDPNVQFFAQTVAQHEADHVAALKKVLGSAAVASPTVNFGAAVTDQATFLATSKALEDTGVAAYAGQGTNILQKPVLVAALSIHSVEARHAAWVRLLLGGAVPQSTPLKSGNGAPAPATFDDPLTEKQTLRIVTATNFITG